MKKILSIIIFITLSTGLSAHIYPRQQIWYANAYFAKEYLIVEFNRSKIHLSRSTIEIVKDVEASYDITSKIIRFDMKTLYYVKIEKNLRENTIAKYVDISWHKSAFTQREKSTLWIIPNENLTLKEQKVPQVAHTPQKYVFKFPILSQKEVLPEVNILKAEIEVLDTTTANVVEGQINLTFDEQFSVKAADAVNFFDSTMSEQSNILHVSFDKNIILNHSEIVKLLGNKSETGNVNLMLHTENKDSAEYIFVFDTFGVQKVDSLSVVSPPDITENNNRMIITYFFNLRLSDPPEDKPSLKTLLEKVASKVPANADEYSNTAYEIYQNAREKNDASRIDGAIKIWESILKEAPDHKSSLAYLGAAYLNKKYYLKAIDIFSTLIELDDFYEYPDALFNICIAYFSQYRNLKTEYENHLIEYIRNNNGNYIEEAKKLRLIVQDKIESEIILTHSNLVNFSKQTVEKSYRNILHFWATWCVPCREEMPELFEFASRNRDVEIIIISTDDRNNNDRVDIFLNEVYAPFKNLNLINVYFIHDPNKRFIDEFLSPRDKRNDLYPKSVFLKYDNGLQTKHGSIEWGSLNPNEIWEN